VPNEIVIQVPQIPLPRALVDSPEYGDLSESAKEALLAHIRYVQEIPFKLLEWSLNGAMSSELEDLVSRIDLDTMIQLGVPKTPQDALSPWVLRTSWVLHSRNLTEFLSAKQITALSGPVIPIASSVDEVASWVGDMANGLSDLLDGFFGAKTADQATATLVAIHVLLAGVRFGMGRVALQFPR
jgi:hypothetical protein